MKNRRYSIDLCSHMAECDANYLRLTKLMPALATEDRRALQLSLGNASPDVRFEVVERSPYTTLVAVTQATTGDIGPMTLQVRLYHDAKSAEVVEIQNQRRFDAVYDYPNSKMRHRDEKVQVNRYLGEFLALCLAHGVSSDEPLSASGAYVIS